MWFQQTYTCTYVSLNSIHKSLESIPGFSGCGNDLLWRQDEAIGACVTQLQCVRVDNTFILIVVVCSNSSSNILGNTNV